VNIDENVEKNIYSTAVEIREHLRSDFDILERRFVEYDAASFEKLAQVVSYMETHPGAKDLSAIDAEINDKVFGSHYVIYVINADKVIVNSTLASEIGVDLKVFPFYENVLERAKRTEEPYALPAPSFDANAMELRRYYVKYSGKGFWVGVGHVLPFESFVRNNIEGMKAYYPSLLALDMYIVTPDRVQHIGQGAKEGNHKASALLLGDLGLRRCPACSYMQLVIDRFQAEDILFLPQVRNIRCVYALARSVAEDEEGFQLAAKMQFDVDYHTNEYAKIEYLIHLFMALFLLFAAMSFFLIYRSVIQKIASITKQMRRDEPIAVSGHLFREFSFLIERYNSFLLRWKREVRRLKKITMQDELTQSANRRYFNKKVRKQIDLYNRYTQPFSMIMLDVDDFKSINDIHGHDAGDHVLRSIADDVKEQIRASDVLCRIGGEEFAVILPETDLESAVTVAEKIRTVIEGQEYIEGKQVTVSLGVGSFRENDDFNTFYQRVDALLYQSKEGGKNCVNAFIEPTL